MKVTSKKEQVRAMFDDISPKYDLLNHLLSLGIDYSWRRKLVWMLLSGNPHSVLDVATGTADLAIAMAKAGVASVTGVDISEKMLAIGRIKTAEQALTGSIALHEADAVHLPFADNTFDAVTVAFGVRNFEDLRAGLTEMKRVLRPGGTLLILEFSHPGTFPMKQLYGFYSRRIIPAIGRIVSGNTQAYNYLPESVRAFPSGNDFLKILSAIGMNHARCHSLTSGISSIYQAEK
jgi:demethylmenaquinone methyltransferase/2-methoxy-6-polyprenyl-1,4-benzoquinol methylase